VGIVKLRLVLWLSITNLFEMSKNPKTPKIKFEPHRKQQPVIGGQFASNDSGPIYWSFSLIDCKGPWGFDSICKNEFHSLITSSFKDKEGITWAKLKSGTGSHNVEISKLVKKAQDRLLDLGIDDRDELFSMRFTGKKRVWGMRDGNVFKVLWWDPAHEVCPSMKKYT